MAPSVDGLVSGMDTTSIITQLMRIEAQPQARLKNTLTSTQGGVTALQSVNSKMAALKTAAEALQKATAWSPATATSSTDKVAVSTTSGASAGSLSFSVKELAQNHVVLAKGTFSSLDDTTQDNPPLVMPLQVRDKNGTVLGTVNPTPTSLRNIIDEINQAANIGVKAVAIKTGENQYSLQLTSTVAGKAGEFNLTDGSGNPQPPAALAVLSAAKDAELDLGGDVLATSSTNTFDGLMPGTSITVMEKTAPGGTVTVNVASDPAKVAESVKAFVDAANSALGTIQAQTRGGTLGADGKITGAGPLKGDAGLRQLTAQIISTVSGTAQVGNTSALQSMAFAGIEVTRNGDLKFDQDKFLKNFKEDPETVRKLVAPSSTAGWNPVSGTPGIAERFVKLSDRATDSVDGSITLAIKSRNNEATSLRNRIDDWDARLEQRQERLQRYYGGLETALGKLKSQSTWLAGQLGGL
ncbi:flagellar filament capping protein FliD [Kineococcus sp. NUM-3379]